MDRSHLDRLKKLCETLPEAELKKMKAGLDGFFKKNPVSGDVRGELRRIQCISGGVSDADLTGIMVGAWLRLLLLGLSFGI